MICDVHRIGMLISGFGQINVNYGVKAPGQNEYRALRFLLQSYAAFKQ